MIPYNVSQTHAGHLNDSHQVPDYAAATIFTNARRETNAKEKNEEKPLITIIFVYKKTGLPNRTNDDFSLRVRL